MPRITARTIVVAGASDGVVTPAAARALAAAIPGAPLAPLVMLDATGHQAHLERPAEVAA